MSQLNTLAEKAKTSKFYLSILNTILLRTVPFNKPHGLRITSITNDELMVVVRNKRSNQNHIKGIHACLLATLCEYVCGLSTTLHLPADEYRIILKSIKMTYHFQAKMDVWVKFKLTKEDIERDILTPLKTSDAVFKESAVEVYDSANNHICTGLINWQIKAWKNTKVKA